MAEAPIFSSLWLENFKTSGKREIDFGRIASVKGRSGADRSQVFDAMRVLHGIAQGKAASYFPALWFGSDWPTTLSLAFDFGDGDRLTYSATLQRIDDKRVRVTEERLDGAGDDLLVRRRHCYTHVANREKSGIATGSFALYDAAKVAGSGDPVARFADLLAKLWLLDPDPNAMRSEIGFGVVNSDSGDFADFATCMVVQQQQKPFAVAMRDAVLRLCPGLVGYSVETNAKGVPYLAVRHIGDLDSRGTPFSLLDNAEKILFLVAFVCAVNESAAPISVMWNSPTGWLGSGGAAVKTLRRSFAHRGQLVMLS